MNTLLRVLIVEDSEDDALLIVRELKRNGFQLHWHRVETHADMEQALICAQWHIIISDYRLPLFDGNQALKLVKEKGLDIPFIIISGEVSDEQAVFMLKNGAQDYINKNNLTRLIPAIARETAEADIRKNEKISQQKLQKSQEILNSFLDSATDAFFLFGSHLELLDINRAGCKLIDMGRQEAISRNILDICPFINADIIKNQISNILLDGHPLHIDLPEVFRGVKRKFFSLKAFRMADGLGIILSDISELKLAHEQIQASLREKEILLSEIHHRVKNNMQIVSGLLYLQKETIHDEQARIKIEESISRIFSIALVHEKLYKSNNFSEIFLKDYMTALINELYAICDVDDKRILHFIDIDPTIHLNITLAIPCGLITNELIMNIFKYAFTNAFTETKNREIHIRVTEKENEIFMTLRDNGIGMDPINFQNPKTLGLSLVHNLVRQINGHVSMNINNGTEFSVSFTK